MVQQISFLCGKWSLFAYLLVVTAQAFFILILVLFIYLPGLITPQDAQRGHVGEDTIEHIMCIYIKGPYYLFNDTLEAVVDYYKEAKKHNLVL